MGSWWLHRRPPQGGGAWQTPPSFPPAADALMPVGEISFPDVARGRPRTAYTAYEPISCPPQPPVATSDFTSPLFFPSRAPAPRRAAVAAYVGLVSSRPFLERPDPVGTLSFPSRAPGPRRAKATAYAGLVSGPVKPDGPQPPAAQVPHVIRGPRRTAATAYQVTVLPSLPDRLPPSGRPAFPDRAYGARRAAVSAYFVPIQRTVYQLPVPTGTGKQVFPDRAPSARRAQATAYTGLVSRPVLGDRNQPSAPSFPSRAPAPRRAPATSYSVVVRPALPDRLMPPGVARFPSVAPAPRRAPATSYAGLLARPIPGDRLQPPGTVHCALPSRIAPRTARTAYDGLLSKIALPDRLMPPGAIRFPSTAPAPRRARPSAYDRRNGPQPPNTVVLTVGSGMALTPHANIGKAWFVSVDAAFSLSAAVPPHAGRIRRGDTVILSFTPPAVPAAIPTVAIKDNSGATILSLEAWSWDEGQTFQVELTPDIQFTASRFTAWCTFVLDDGSASAATVTFDLVAGGDPASDVVSLYSHDGLSGRAVIGQSKSGVLVFGQGGYVG